MKAKTVGLCGKNVLHSTGRCRRAFTLIELLAVILVILVLAAIGMGVAGFVQQRMAVANAKSQIAAMEVALENYKADWGYYPPTSHLRMSRLGAVEATNNWYLYRALSGTCSNCTKTYLRFSSGQIRSNMLISIVSATSTGQALNIYDPWGKPFNYYCSPTTPFATASSPGMGFTQGGQVNIMSFDLFSYGPDGCSYVPGILYTGWNSPVWPTNWIKSESALDDVTNWK